MAQNFEIKITVRVNISQDASAEHLEEHLRQPDIQNRLRDVVGRLLPLLEIKKRAAQYKVEILPLTVVAIK